MPLHEAYKPYVAHVSSDLKKMSLVKREEKHDFDGQEEIVTGSE